MTSKPNPRDARSAYRVFARTLRSLLVGMACAAAISMPATSRIQTQQYPEVTARIQLSGQASPAGRHITKMPPAVLWLNPITAGLTLPKAAPVPGGYTLLQKNKMFSPHLLVVPTGSVVLFPNQDPFFHNVFSLFEGKRFDLGLYEAGKTKEVTFSREGVSYIFCNIHSDMSAVVIALATPLYSIADDHGTFHISDVPPGDYDMHLWVEGQRQEVLDHWIRRVHISPANLSLGTILLDSSPAAAKHNNKFGQSYDHEQQPPY
jgi:hypothetical protein